jgi:TonB family protein
MSHKNKVIGIGNHSYCFILFKIKLIILPFFCPFLTIAQTDTEKIATLDTTIYSVVEQMPEFPGGEEGLFQYLSRVNYPIQARINGITGKVYITFVISKNGKVRNAKILRGLGFGCDEAVLNLINGMPDWKPGKQNGSPVDVQFNLPVNFKISNGPPTVSSQPLLTTNKENYNLGVESLNKGDTLKAIDYFTKAITSNATDIDALYNRGVLKFKTHDTLGACKDWSNAKKLGDKESNKLFNKHCNTSISDADADTSLELNLTVNQISELMANDSISKELIMPSFPGGEEKLFMFLQKVKLPAKAKENKISGRVFATFLVTKEGKIKNASIIRGLGYGCDEELLRVINLMPDWIPGRLNGNAVGMYYNLPVNFNKY